MDTSALLDSSLLVCRSLLMTHDTADMLFSSSSFPVKERQFPVVQVEYPCVSWFG